MPLLHLDDKNFKTEVLGSKVPVLVDFFAAWCSPCKAIAPLIEEMAKEYEGRIKVCKLDVDDGNAVASQYGIMSVPTLMIFKGGLVVHQSSGVLTKQQLKEKLDAAL